MKTLLVFYSRTGNTKKVAEEIEKNLKCDIEQIRDVKDRSGFAGYIRSGKEALKKELPPIRKTKYDASNYDLVIIGTPVWAWNMASPIRTYIIKNAKKIKKTAFFCTMGGSGDKQAFEEMTEFIKKPAATLVVLTKEVHQDNFNNKIKKFIKDI